MHTAAVVSATSATTQLETLAACDLCGRRQFKLKHEWGDPLLFGPERWQLVSCEQCSLHFINPRPTREAIGAFYCG